MTADDLANCSTVGAHRAPLQLPRQGPGAQFPCSATLTYTAGAMRRLVCAGTLSIFLFLPNAFGQIGAGAKFSTLGIGFEAAVAVSERSNVRGGFNFFNYDHGFSRDGIDYLTDLRFRSVEAHYDWFLGHGFHASPGLLVYNGNKAEGKAFVPGGRSFTLGTVSYVSNPANPVNGTGEFHFSSVKASPMITAGFGNLARRTGRGFSISFEGGVVFESEPETHLNLTGSACRAGFCADVASSPQIQSDLRAEEEKFNNGTISGVDTVHSLLKFYPVVSIGVGYRFK
jgi:hypothetical protein